MLQIKNLKEKQREGNVTLSVVLYGESGVGKTTLASTAAELGRVLYVDSEAGTKFIADEYAGNIDILALKDVDLLDEVLRPENIKGYNTIVLDSVTEIMKKLVDKAKGNKEVAQVQDWGKVISKMEWYIRQFRDLEKNVILVALEQEYPDGDSLVKRPSLSGKSLPQNIVGYMDVCLYMESTQTGRRLHTNPTGAFYAKDRTKTLPKVIEGEDINFKYIVDLATSIPEEATKEQLAEIGEKMKELGLDKDKEAQKKALDYLEAKSIKGLNYLQASKMIEVLDAKLKLNAKK